MTVVEQLVGRVPRWNVIARGVGAPAARPGLGSVPGWVASGALVGAVARSDAVLLPYHHATQSGAVVLGQVLGAVPVVSAVGGIPEQVTDGVDGILVHAGAGVDAWSVALERLSFKGTVDSVRQFSAAIAQARSRKMKTRLMARLLEIIARDQVPDRPGRLRKESRHVEDQQLSRGRSARRPIRRIR
jgi:glycosyltransferase involved in cell wall biosynthesis